MQGSGLRDPQRWLPALMLIPPALTLAWGQAYGDDAYLRFQAARSLAEGRSGDLGAAPLYVLLLVPAARLCLPSLAMGLSALGWAIAVGAWLQIGRAMASSALGVAAALLVALHPLQGRTLGLESGLAIGLASLGILQALRRRTVALALLTPVLTALQPTMAPLALLLWIAWLTWRRHPPGLVHLTGGAALWAGILALACTLRGVWTDPCLIVPLVVALQVLIAAGVAASSKTRTGWPLALLGLAGLLIAEGNLLLQDRQMRPNDRLTLVRQLAGWIQTHTLPTDVIGAPCPGLIGYLSSRPVLPLPGDGTVDQLLAVLQTQAPEFCLTPHSLPWQLLQSQPWFLERYRLVYQAISPYEPTASLSVYQYAPSPFDAGEMVTTPFAFSPGPGQRLELAAYRLDSQRIVPGQPLHLTLYWRTATVLDQPLHLTILLTQEASGESRRWAENTAPGGLPTDLWNPDATVADRYLLSPPPDLPPGDYRLSLALRLPSGKPVMASVPDEATIPQETATLTRLYRPATVSLEQPTPDHPLHLTLGNRVELVGYDAPTRVAPGDTFRVALYWRARGPIVLDYKVFVHLLTADTRLIAQSDSEPVAWTYPTSRWQAGEYVMDEHWLSVEPQAPRGDAWLSVGLYDPATGERLPIRDEAGEEMAEGRAVLQVIQVR